MATNNQVFLSGISIKIQGDCGPLSSYTNKNGKIVFLKAWLRDPASPKQIAHRNRIRACAKTWKAAPQTTRTNYERATKNLSLYLNGYNLWVCASMTSDGRSALTTLARQTGLQLLPPPPN